MTKASVALAILVLALMHVNTLQLILLAQSSNSLRIAITFPFMIKDVEGILCDDDEVFSITPAGLDPHDYQLTPRDIEVLSRSNLVISTAHTHFETEIRELILAGELKAELVEVPSIPGLIILENPSTGVANYHGVLFHGDNYAVFIKHIARVLSNLRPTCSDVYMGRAEELRQRIERVSALKPLRGFRAVIDSPVLQYLVSWLGAEVEHIAMVEHEVPVLPQDIDKVQEVLRRYGKDVVVILTEDSVVRSVLEELAQKFGTRVIVVPNPVVSTNSILAYLERIVIGVYNTSKTTITTTHTDADNSRYLLVVALAIAPAVIIATLVVLRTRRWGS